MAGRRGISRRSWLALTGAAAPLCFAGQDANLDWVCPMDADVRAAKPGVCPRCGMKLRLGVPERKEFELSVTQSPELLKPGCRAHLTLRVMDPETSAPVKDFEVVHEKLLHLFVVSENLEHFAHIHPVLQADGSFTIDVELPLAGMYRFLTDFYPRGSVPQLLTATLYVPGPAPVTQLQAAISPYRAANLTASLRCEPEQAMAGLETKLKFALDPARDLQPYLGAWAHMLAASADLVDMIHVHPFLADGSGRMQFNVIFPRAGTYRIWTQFQRAGEVNTTVFTIPVQAL